MSQEKPCLHCGIVFSRPDGAKNKDWFSRKYCSVGCRRDVADASRIKHDTFCEALGKRYGDLTVRDIIRACGGSTKMSEKLQVFASDIRAWERVPNRLGTRVRMLCDLPLWAVLGARSDKPKAEPAPEPARARMQRFGSDPLPAGSSVTWGEMMPGIAWKQAKLETVGMRP